MCQWTPSGWTSCLGPHLSLGHLEDEPLCGEVFDLEAKAREEPEKYKSVLRAQWIGESLGEERADGMRPGSGGFWHALAFQQKLVTAKEVGSRPSPDLVRRPELKVTADDKRITSDKAGVITIPAAACKIEGDDPGKPLLMESHAGGIQIHLPRQGKRPSPSTFTYSVNVPQTGTYALTAKVVTIHRDAGLSLTINGEARHEPMKIPYTAGSWDDSDKVLIKLKQGENTLLFSGRAGSNGVTIMEFILRSEK